MWRELVFGKKTFVKEFRLLLEGLGLETVDFKISLRQQLTYVENSLNYPDSASRFFSNLSCIFNFIIIFFLLRNGFFILPPAYWPSGNVCFTFSLEQFQQINEGHDIVLGPMLIILQNVEVTV